MKKMSIKMAILIPALAVLAVGIAAMVITVGILSFSMTQDLTDRLVDARVNEYTGEFRAISQDAYGAISAIAPIVENAAASADDPRAEIVSVLEGAISGSSTMVGIWTCWEPNALDGQDSRFANTGFHDDTGRFAPYIVRNGSGGYHIEALADYDDPVAGDYYLGALNSGAPHITDPFYYVANGQELLVYTIAIPVIKDGGVAGVVGVDIDIHTLMEAMNRGTILDDGYIYTISPGGLIATHPNEAVWLEDFRNNWLGAYTADIEAVLSGGGSFTVEAYSAQADENIHFLANAVEIGDTNRYWAVCGVVPVNTVTASSLSLLFWVIAIGFALVAVVGVTLFLIIRARLKQLPVLTGTAMAMATGNINAAKTDIEQTAKTNNEITLLERAFADMATGIKQQAGILSLIAQGDYSETIPVRSNEDVMNRAISDMLDSTNAMLFDIQQAASQVAMGSSQIAHAAQSLATGSTQQAATLEEFSATIAEIHSQAEGSAQLAQHTKASTDKAGAHMAEGMGKMSELTAAMSTIDGSSQEIEKVIKVIDDIAFQTNILALNAAVEAARAGDAGKGFAVVADEVRTLAGKSAEAASETAALIQNSVESVRRGTEITAQTAESLASASEIAQENAADLERLNAMSQQTTASITEINIGVGQISDVVQANSATAEESAASSEEMNAQSNMLNEIVGRFKLRQNFAAGQREKQGEQAHLLGSGEHRGNAAPGPDDPIF